MTASRPLAQRHSRDLPPRQDDRHSQEKLHKCRARLSRVGAVRSCRMRTNEGSLELRCNARLGTESNLPGITVARKPDQDAVYPKRTMIVSSTRLPIRISLESSECPWVEEQENK